MRTEVKAGIFVGVLAIAVAIIYISSRTGRTQGEVPMDNPNVSASTDQSGSGSARESGRASGDASPQPRASRVQTPPRQTSPGSTEPHSALADRHTSSPTDRTIPAPTGPLTRTDTSDRTRSPDTMREPEGPTPGTAGITGPRIGPVTPPGTTATDTETVPGIETLPPRARVAVPTETLGEEPAPTPTEPIATPTRTLPEPAPRETLVPAGETYTVKDNDRLTYIVRDHYGSERYLAAVVAANPGMNPDVIKVGQKITLPPREALERGAATATPTRDTTGTPALAGESYTVKEGDLLTYIVRDRYGSESYLAAVVAANPGMNPDRILVGQKIKLPPKNTVDTRQPTSTPAATGGRSADGLTYVVEEGDTLTKIAKNALGDGERWKEIYELNKDKLESADVVTVGLKLKLPPKQR
ncbi:MAG: LysM peptidoglycan-binding domain-containing protein [Phycisphaerae bacterium]|nr:LysM peptidoglycan-binding domain-containing protein [Phycisphaerae bacterium]